MKTNGWMEERNRGLCSNCFDECLPSSKLCNLCKKEKKRSEHVEQREFVQWFRQTYPNVRIFAIPNGGARNISVAAKLKAEGVSRGVPDLFVPEWKLWIEMKAVNNISKLSEFQKSWIKYLISKDYAVIVAHGFEEAKMDVIKYLNRESDSE